MDEATIISLIAVACVAIFSSITAPLILARRTERMHREDQLADYKRQDEVAKEAKETAIAMAEQQDVIIRQQHEATEAARVRDGHAEKIAAAVAKSNGDKLDVIHQLVNSQLSATIKSELDAHVTSLALMREVIDMKRVAGSEPTEEALIAIESTKAKIAELRTTLADRLRQAESQAATAETVAEKAEAATALAREHGSQKAPL